VAQINVGAASETELKEKKARVEDALHATRAAVEEGIVPGGGVSFIRAIDALDKVRKSARADEKFGVDIVEEALMVPTRTIADNAGVKGTVVVSKVRAASGAHGFNAMTLEYTDLVKAGVITPAKVDRTALQNAASVAGLLLTADCIVTESPQEKKKDGHAGPGHGAGMGMGM
jgi:chaperonin GroEL